MFSISMEFKFTFSEWKSLYIDYSGKLQKAQIDAVKI